MKRFPNNLHRSKAGFTLIEILVVLVIAAVLAAVILGGYSAMRKSNARTSCQANMVQVYRALRLYSADYGGNAPYYNPENNLGASYGGGIGLWALYGFSNTSNSDELAGVDIKPEQRYLTNAKLFHCPWDTETDQLYTDSSQTEYNPDFLSYQVSDTGCSDISDSACSGAYADTQYTYNPVRSVGGVTGLDVSWQRQLLHYYNKMASTGDYKLEARPPTNDTIVFWCPFHRGRSGNGEDNVLFWDGTIQAIPAQQDIDGTVYEGWQRLPEHQAH